MTLPTLHAGLREDDTPRRVKLTDGQMKTLGFGATKPKKVACGRSACAYLPSEGSDAIVKITKDERDAIVASLIRGMEARPSWAIPIYATYRLPKNTFVIVCAKAEPLTEEWADPIDEIYDYCADEEEHGPDGLRPHEWDGWRGFRGMLERIAELEAMTGIKEKSKLIRRSVELVNNAVISLRELGLEWSDFHSRNWGMWSGRPVIIDFGVPRLRPEDGFDLSKVPPHPALKSIPILPF